MASFRARMCLLESRGCDSLIRGWNPSIYGARIGIFKPNAQKYWKLHIIKMTASVQTEFLHNTKDHRLLIVGGSNTRPTNPRWRTAAILIRTLNRHVAIVRPILMKFGTVAHVSHTTDWPLKFRIFENQDGGGRHLENHKYHDISATVWLIFTKMVK